MQRHSSKTSFTGLEFGVTRRQALRTGIAAATSAIAAPYVSRSALAKEQTLYINTWGGSWERNASAAFFQPFSKATGIAIKTESPVTFAKLKAEVMTHQYDWDVTTQGQPDCVRGMRENLLEPVNYKIIDPTKLSPHAITYNGIASHALGTCLAYRKDKFPNGGPQSWKDFWDVDRFRGNRAMYKNAARVLPAALLADGVPRDKLYPLDVDRAFRKLDQIKPHIKVWWHQGSQSEQLLRDNEVDMIQMWNGRAAQLIRQKVPVQLVWNDAEILTVNWIVVRGTPRADLAWRYIQFAHQPELQAKFALTMDYGPANPKAFEYIPEAAAKQLPTWPDNEKVAYHPDPEWVGAHMNEIAKRFDAWLIS
jgi:putative spermidine/putrescine transport system substrate-binding protein